MDSTPASTRDNSTEFRATRWNEFGLILEELLQAEAQFEKGQHAVRPLRPHGIKPPPPAQGTGRDG